MRVHIVGEHWFAVRLKSTADDYRYARAGSTVELSAFELPEHVGKHLVALVRGMNLLVAGVDLRRTLDGSWVCFEVNPSPAFPWYEEATGDEIAVAIANLLMSCNGSRRQTSAWMTIWISQT